MQHRLKMTAARAERMFRLKIVDAPRQMRVETVDQPSLTAIAPDPPIEPMPPTPPPPAPVPQEGASSTAATGAAVANRGRGACGLGARSRHLPAQEGQREAACGRPQEAADARSASRRAPAPRHPTLRRGERLGGLNPPCPLCKA